MTSPDPTTLVTALGVEPTYSAREAAVLLGRSYSWLDQRVRNEQFILLDGTAVQPLRTPGGYRRFTGRFAETSGMVAEVGEKIALITYPGQEQNAALRLARSGSDNAIGYLSVDRGGMFSSALRGLVQPGPRTTVAELDRLLADDALTLIDIRNLGERKLGNIPGPMHIPLPQLRNQLEQVPIDKPIVVHCAGGWRSSVAASLMRANGFEQVSDLVGGYNRWAQAHSAA
jgi:hydroxyacylglutathione hydrolase